MAVFLCFGNIGLSSIIIYSTVQSYKLQPDKIRHQIDRIINETPEKPFIFSLKVRSSHLFEVVLNEMAIGGHKSVNR